MKTEVEIKDIQEVRDILKDTKKAIEIANAFVNLFSLLKRDERTGRIDFESFEDVEKAWKKCEDLAMGME